VILNATQTVQDGVGVVGVQECLAGTYTDPSQIGCVPCKPGTFSTMSKASSNATCQACTAGTWSNVSGANNQGVCTQCNNNTYSSTTGAPSITTCLPCAANAVSQPGAQYNTGCICLPGYYRPDDLFSSSCVLCTAGYWCLGGQRTQCISGADSLAGAVSAGMCYCMSGYSGDTITEGLIVCTLCWSDFYCPGGSNKSSAIRCPEQSSSLNGASRVEDCTCSPGYIQVRCCSSFCS
jgi:hypothetical protein